MKKADRNKVKTNGDQRLPHQHYDNVDNCERHIDGSIAVRGEIEAKLSPDLIRKYDTERQEDSAHEKNKFKVEIITLILLFIVAVLNAAQVYYTRRATIIDQRPNVWTLEKRMDKDVHLSPNEKMSVNLTWVNYGKQPAIRATAIGKIFVGPTAVQEADKWFARLGNGPIKTNWESESIIPPAIPSDPDKPLSDFSSASTDNALKPEDVQYVLAHNESIAIVARIQYFDAFGNRYWSDICLSRYTNGAFPQCAQHNEMH